MVDDEDNILDERTEGGIPSSHIMTSLDSQRHGNYFSTQTSNTTRSGNPPERGGDGSSLFSVMNKKVNDPIADDDSDSSEFNENEMTHGSKGTLKAKPKKDKVDKITQGGIGKHKERPSTVNKLQKQQTSSKSGKSAMETKGASRKRKQE